MRQIKSKLTQECFKYIFLNFLFLNGFIVSKSSSNLEIIMKLNINSILIFNSKIRNFSSILNVNLASAH
jgi:hypothetical protein